MTTAFQSSAFQNNAFQIDNTATGADSWPSDTYKRKHKQDHIGRGQASLDAILDQITAELRGEAYPKIEAGAVAEQKPSIAKPALLAYDEDDEEILFLI